MKFCCPLVPLLREEGVSVFREWSENPRRVSY